MRYDVCDRCGVKIPEGGLKYIVAIHIVADTDNVISGDISDDELDLLISEVERADPDMMERDVHQELAFILCKRCKEQFARNPFNISVDISDKGKRWGGDMH